MPQVAKKECLAASNLQLVYSPQPLIKLGVGWHLRWLWREFHWTQAAPIETSASELLLELELHLKWLCSRLMKESIVRKGHEKRLGTKALVPKKGTKHSTALYFIAVGTRLNRKEFRARSWEPFAAAVQSWGLCTWRYSWCAWNWYREVHCHQILPGCKNVPCCTCFNCWYLILKCKSLCQLVCCKPKIRSRAMLS